MQVKTDIPRHLAPLAAGLLMLATAPVHAAQIDVGPNGCTLEDAIIAANANAAHGSCPAGEPGRDAIVLEHNSVHELSGAFLTVDYGAVATPPIREALLIIGRGATVRRAEGAPPARLLLAAGIHEPTVSLSILDLTLEGGIANEFGGGGILFVSRNADESLSLQRTTLRGNAAPELPGGGGAIRFVGPESAPAGSLTLLQAQVIDNTASDRGAGVHVSDAQVRIEDSTFSGNRTSDSSGALAVFNQERDGVPPREALISTSTFSGNEAINGGGLIVFGRVRLLDNTITGNRTERSPSGLLLFGAQAELERNLIAGNTSPESAEITVALSAVTRSRNNLIGVNGNAGIEKLWGMYDLDVTDIVPTVGIDAILAPLASNGGSTQTHALVAGSPAIDAIPAESCAQGDPATDQRGVSRPRGAGCDIGAYEFGGPTRLEVLPLVQTLVRQGLRLRQQVTASARITNPGGLSVQGLTVRFSAGQTALCEAVSDADGMASCVAQPLTLLNSLLNLGYTATFDGDDTWDASEGQSGLLGGGL